MIRPVTVDDIPWGLSLVHERYGDFDPGGGLVAIGQAMRLPTALAIRSDHGFLVAQVIAPGWWPKRRTCQILWLCTEPGYHWEAVKLLRASICWAKERGCIRWWVDSDTEHEVGPLAERVGARERPFWEIDFTLEAR